MPINVNSRPAFGYNSNIIKFQVPTCPVKAMRTAFNNNLVQFNEPSLKETRNLLLNILCNAGAEKKKVVQYIKEKYLFAKKNNLKIETILKDTLNKFSQQTENQIECIARNINLNIRVKQKENEIINPKKLQPVVKSFKEKLFDGIKKLFKR